MKNKEHDHKDKPKSDQPQHRSEMPNADQEKNAACDEQLAQAIKEKADTYAQLQRVSADYANFQKRVPRQISDAVAYEKETLIRSLLPALDNFEHAIDKSHTAESAQTVIEGIKIVYDQLLAILKSHGVEQLQAQGQKFDPATHSAISQRSEPDKDDNIVLEDFAKGYKLNGRVIRPSRVAVNKIVVPAPDASAPSQQDGQVPGDLKKTDTE